MLTCPSLFQTNRDKYCEPGGELEQRPVPVTNRLNMSLVPPPGSWRTRQVETIPGPQPPASRFMLDEPRCVVTSQGCGRLTVVASDLERVPVTASLIISYHCWHVEAALVTEKYRGQHELGEDPTEQCKVVFYKQLYYDRGCFSLDNRPKIVSLTDAESADGDGDKAKATTLVQAGMQAGRHQLFHVLGVVLHGCVIGARSGHTHFDVRYLSQDLRIEPCLEIRNFCH
ncbi:hypothetical protein RRG08_008226 [Elysia crispata]|uniref:Uncharacterized protein n=1 Tax=Elysia crispata TaxID=231223 RepID=A0AAE0YBB0_9GAST|nr:hypothetical protein RRG08_008226 [Elysia crispata]